MFFKNQNPLFLIGLIGSFTIGSIFFVDIYNAFFGDENIYWTHQSMKLSIDETENDFQVFISGKKLKNHLDDKTLYAVDQSGAQYIVVKDDVTARLNNWNKTKSEILTKAVFTGFASGIALTLVIIGLFQTKIQINKNRAQALSKIEE